MQHNADLGAKLQECGVKLTVSRLSDEKLKQIASLIDAIIKVLDSK